VMFRRQYERALRMLWEHRDRQRELSAPATPPRRRRRAPSPDFPPPPAAGFPSALAEGCIPTVLPAPSPTDFPSPQNSPRARARATAAAQRLPPTVREGCIPPVPPAPSPADFPPPLGGGCIPTVPGSTPHSANACIPTVPPPATPSPSTPSQTRKSDFTKRTETCPSPPPHSGSARTPPCAALSYRLPRIDPGQKPARTPRRVRIVTQPSPIRAKCHPADGGKLRFSQRKPLHFRIRQFGMPCALSRATSSRHRLKHPSR
jgi:hypothetical protein